MATRQYIGARYVPKFYTNSVDGTAAWERNVVYEPLTYVTLTNAHIYISKKQVPATVGTPASNAEYWLDVGSYNGFIDDLQNQINGIDSKIQALIESVDPIDFDIIVDINGTGDYTSLATAVSAANDGDRIYVKKGTYTGETVDAQTKTLTIIGEDVAKTIIKNNFVDYSRAPLEIGSGIVKNLQFVSEGTLVDNASYGVHIDYQILMNKTLTFENCKFASASTYSVGIGTRKNSLITFNRCEFLSTSVDKGALFVHPSTDSNNYGGSQEILLIDCVLRAVSQAVIATTKYGPNTNNVIITCLGCQLRTSTNQMVGLIWQGTSDEHQGKIVFAKGAGNNYAFLNQNTHALDTSEITVGRIENSVVKRVKIETAITANTQKTITFPSDCGYVLGFDAYIKNGSIWYPAGTHYPGTSIEHEAYYTEVDGSYTGYAISTADGTARIYLTYLSNDATNL